MPSTKRRTSSSSGGSPASTRKPARSRPSRNTCATSPASFVEVFGQEETPEQKRYRALKAAAIERLENLMAAPMPTNGLLRARLKQKIAREKKQIQYLDELLDLTPTA